jgi:hypothetical protein
LTSNENVRPDMSPPKCAVAATLPGQRKAGAGLPFGELPQPRIP